MKTMYTGIQWVVQQNLTNSNELIALQTACKDLGIESIPINITPFTTELPKFDKSRISIFYGSTTLNNLVLSDSELKNGLFYDEATFSIENYFDNWKEHMLNYGGQITSFSELLTQPYTADKLLFIRPDDDSKSFSGEVKMFSEIKNWYEKLKIIENTNLTISSRIVTSEPYSLQYEWRLWIVNKKVVAASKYREYFILTIERGCPVEVISFAEERCKEYTPNNVFVMDVCLCGDRMYIVECGCMNNAGFYKADVHKIVESVSLWFANKNGSN